MLEDTQQYLHVGGEAVEIKKVKNFEALITDPADPDKVPCWAEVWPASLGMGEHLASREDLEGATVLELGAGLGLPGVVAGMKGAKVTFSDFNELSLEYCRKNAEANGLKEFNILLGDWRNFPQDLAFDLVLGSDIVYEPRLLPYLERVLSRFSREGSTILLSHAYRSVTFSFAEEICRKEELTNEVDYLRVEMEDSLLTYYRIAVHELRAK